jgi:hypothetical protein
MITPFLLYNTISNSPSGGELEVYTPPGIKSCIGVLEEKPAIPMEWPV